MKERTEIDKPK